MNGKCAILYSGGTDSTCAAAVCAEKFSEIHLLTFHERGTASSPVPEKNIAALRAKFPGVRFESRVIQVDALVRKISYDRYLSTIRRHGLFTLATPGFSSLSWHTATIHYCRKHGITNAADGLTRELMHFPGHMDKVVALFRAFYSENGIHYENPVRDWPVPPDQQLLDRLIVDRHDFYVSPGEAPAFRERTTGRYLFDKGLMPNPNVKGSKLDRSMQHDCYPFVLYNIFAFWLFLPFHSFEEYEARIETLLKEKIAAVREWLAGGALDGLVREA